VIDRLNPDKLLVHQLYRAACRDDKHDRPVEDDVACSRPSDRAVSIDDNLNIYAMMPKNAIPMPLFVTIDQGLP
jgi:TFIIF-interacting CTD phosphatase-like protein